MSRFSGEDMRRAVLRMAERKEEAGTITGHIGKEKSEMFDTIAEKLLRTLYEHMWFRGPLPEEGWAIEQIKLALEEAADE